MPRASPIGGAVEPIVRPVSVGRRSLLLLPLALVSRGIAFGVPVFLARWYGASTDMDAFYYAIGIPTFLLVVGTSAVGSVLVPALARVPTERGADGAGALLGGASMLAGAAAVVLGGALAAVLPPILRATSDFDAGTVDLTQYFCAALLPFLWCVAVGSALRAGVELQGRFAWSALSPMVRTSVLLVGAALLRERGPTGLPIAMFGGMATELAWLLAGLWRTPMQPSIALWPSTLGPALARFAPVLVGETLVALNVVVDKIFAARLPAGSVSLLEYADRARVIPMTLFEASLLVVAFNSWALVPAERRGAEIVRALRWVLMLAPPVLAGLWIGRVAAVRLVFEHGAFVAEDTLPVAAAFGAFIPGILAAMLAALAVKAHLLADRARLVLVLGVASFAINALLDEALLPRGIAGLALATTIASAVIASLSLARLAPELPPGDWRAPAVVLMGSLAVAAGSSAAGLRPDSIADPTLWALSVPCFGLLAVGVLAGRA